MIFELAKDVALLLSLSIIQGFNSLLWDRHETAREIVTKSVNGTADISHKKRQYPL
jgi:hypothetical protein